MTGLSSRRHSRERCREEEFTVNKTEGLTVYENVKVEKEMSKEDNTELEKIRRSISQMREEDKLLMLTDRFKIKK
jgi:hypothetical protein